MKPLHEATLEQSEVVANAAMSRSRGLEGVDSYARELRRDALGQLTAQVERKGRVARLDLCCGTGQALQAATRLLHERHPEASVTAIGLDLFPPTVGRAERAGSPHVVQASAHAWEPPLPFDLITCVHGLHSIGDELGLLVRIARWPCPDGRFVGNLDLADIRLENGDSLAPELRKLLSAAGAECSSHSKVLGFAGGTDLTFPYTFAGSDDSVGPNSTRQPVVHSCHEPARPAERFF